MLKSRRAIAAKKAAPRKTKTTSRRLVLAKLAPTESLTPDEVSNLETLVKRFEESERAWQRMTAAPEDADPWTLVEDHLLQRRGDASDRRWKFFSK
jgi:hypothetical protein